jgi:hypothetical protein
LKPLIYLELYALAGCQKLFYKITPDKLRGNSFTEWFEWWLVKRMLRLQASLYDDMPIENVNHFLGEVEEKVIKKDK